MPTPSQLDNQSGNPNEDQTSVTMLVSRISLLENQMAELQKAFDSLSSRDKLYDVKALAKRWGVSVRTVRYLVAEKRLIPTYIKTASRFTIDAIEAYERGNSGWDKRRQTRRAVIRKKYNHVTGLWEKPGH